MKSWHCKSWSCGSWSCESCSRVCKSTVPSFPHTTQVTLLDPRSGKKLVWRLQIFNPMHHTFQLYLFLYIHSQFKPKLNQNMYSRFTKCFLHRKLADSCKHQHNHRHSNTCHQDSVTRQLRVISLTRVNVYLRGSRYSRAICPRLKLQRCWSLFKIPSYIGQWMLS